MTFYRRKLPHWHPGRASIFLTWRLIGSVPAVFPGNPNAPDAGKEFFIADRTLDRATTGALWLACADIAQTVVDTLLYGEQP